MADESESAAAPRPTTAVAFDPDVKQHRTGRGHPESPERYEAVMSALKAADFWKRLQPLRPKQITDADLKRCHSAQYIKTAKRDIQAGLAALSKFSKLLRCRSDRP